MYHLLVYAFHIFFHVFQVDNIAFGVGSKWISAQHLTLGSYAIAKNLLFKVSTDRKRVFAQLGNLWSDWATMFVGNLLS